MAFINERQTNKQAKKTFKKNQNYSRFPLTNDDNYIIMANMTNNNKSMRGSTMVNVLQTVVRDGEWVVDVIGRFNNLRDALECFHRCHNGNPTTRIRFE